MKYNGNYNFDSQIQTNNKENLRSIQYLIPIPRPVPPERSAAGRIGSAVTALIAVPTRTGCAAAAVELPAVAAAAAGWSVAAAAPSVPGAVEGVHFVRR